MDIYSHLEKIKYFQRLSEFSSLNEASKVLGISQGGLSKNILILEEILDLKLLMRNQNGFKLTREGELLAKSANEIKIIVKSLESKLMAKRKMTLPKKLMIGIYDSFAVYFYPALSDYLKSIFPQVEVRITVDRSLIIAEKLANGELDLVMGSGFGPLSEEILNFKLLDDYYSFYAKPNLKGSLDELPLLTNFTGDLENKYGLDRNTKKAFEVKTTHHIVNFETTKELAAIGMGIAVIPTLVARPMIKSNSLTQVKLMKCKNIFTPHTIEMLTTKTVYAKHGEFIHEIVNFAKKWSIEHI